MLHKLKPMNPSNLARRNRRVVIIALFFAFTMLALSFAAVPLYRIFCQATGLGGTTQNAVRAPDKIPANTRRITIRFDAAVDARLPWRFQPEQNTLSILIGQTGMISYTAHNTSIHATTGIAIHNVNPLKAGKYFVKTQCFCFNNQTLGPHQAAHMPVVFYIDPKILADPNMQDIQEITLSYEFYPAGSQAATDATRHYQGD